MAHGQSPQTSHVLRAGPSRLIALRCFHRLQQGINQLHVLSGQNTNDVIIERWQSLTGKEAVLGATGETFAVRAARDSETVPLAGSSSEAQP